MNYRTINCSIEYLFALCLFDVYCRHVGFNNLILFTKFREFKFSIVLTGRFPFRVFFFQWKNVH